MVLLLVLVYAANICHCCTNHIQLIFQELVVSTQKKNNKIIHYLQLNTVEVHQSGSQQSRMPMCLPSIKINVIIFVFFKMSLNQIKTLESFWEVFEIVQDHQESLGINFSWNRLFIYQFISEQITVIASKYKNRIKVHLSKLGS